MTSDLQYYFNFSDDVRNSCIEGKLIEKDQLSISFDDCKKIVKYFGGIFDSNPSYKLSSMIKISENEFKIECNPDVNSLDIIHELGHAFLHFNDMEINDRYSCDGNSFEDIEACIFSRAFIMPKPLFEKVVFKYVIDGICNLIDVARTFNVECIQADLRGKELNIWE